MPVTGSRSAIAESFLYLGGQPYSLDEYPPIRDIFDRFNKAVLFMAGRQVSKSTTVAVQTVLDSTRPHWSTLYVAPTQKQRNVFSNTRLGKLIHYSPRFRDLYLKTRPTGGRVKDDVGHKMLANGAEIHLMYAKDDPDRIRSISANKCIYDEIQDIDYDAVIPVVNETMSASRYGNLVVYAGTPKSVEAGIHHIWENSTQTHWLMKCSRCNRYNLPGIGNIGDDGPICAKCGKGLNVRDGFWQDMVAEEPGNEGGRVRGYHLPQIIFPFHTENPIKWKELVNKLRGPSRYPLAKFKNEVMGLSESLGARMITWEMLADLTDESLPYGDVDLSRYSYTYAGVDWSGEGKTHQSLTSVYVWGVNATTLMPETIFSKAFIPGHPVRDIEEICEIVKRYKCRLVGGDAGNGQVANALLRQKLGHHVALGIRMGAQATLMRWDAETSSYFVDKTQLLDAFFLAITRAGVRFGPVKVMDTAFKHFLSEYEEITQDGAGKRVWRRSASKPDDLLFAAAFGWFLACHAHDMLRVYL